MTKEGQNYIPLVDIIETFFQEGMILSDDVLHFIDSTFSNPSLKELGEILEDESNLERDSLVELIFSPDESMQLQLENILLNETFEKDDGKKIADVLCSKKLDTSIAFPDGRGKLEIHVPDEAMALFVSKLNIHWKPDDAIIKTIDPIDEWTAVTQRVRSKMIQLSETKTDTLCVFLKEADRKDPKFFNCLDYLLDTINGLSDTDDLYEILSRRKHQYNDAIRKRQEFEILLTKSNPETLFLQGINAPFINIDAMRKRIANIDTITLAVYGKIVYCS